MFNPEYIDESVFQLQQEKKLERQDFNGANENKVDHSHQVRATKPEIKDRVYSLVERQRGQKLN